MTFDWDDLKIVLVVSRARSFQGAARLLRLTHTTVGRRIAALEVQLGHRLFLRENRACVPTAACARLIDAAQRIEAEVRQARDTLGPAGPEASRPGPSGTVRLVSVNWVVNDVLLPDVPTLRAACPDIRLRLHGTLSDAEETSGEAVIFLRFELQPARGEEVIPVARIAYSVYGPADCAAPRDLPWISFGGSMPLDWLEAQGVAGPEVVLTVNDAGAVRTAILAGVGRGLLPDCLGATCPGLRRLSGPAPEFQRTLRAIGRKDDLTGAAGGNVLGWIERRFAALGCEIG